MKFCRSRPYLLNRLVVPASCRWNLLPKTERPLSFCFITQTENMQMKIANTNGSRLLRPSGLTSTEEVGLGEEWPDHHKVGGTTLASPWTATSGPRVQAFVGAARPQQMPISHTGMEIDMKVTRQTLAKLVAGEAVPCRIETAEISADATTPNATLSCNITDGQINAEIRVDGLTLLRLALS